MERKTSIRNDPKLYTSDPRVVVRYLLEQDQKNVDDNISILDEVIVSNKIDKRFSSYDKQFKSLRFTNLTKNKDIVRHLAIIKSYNFVRDAAVGVLRNIIINKLHLFKANSWCTHDGPAHELKDIPHDLFSWSYKEFQKRLNLPNLVFIDFLTKQIPMECLEKLKYFADLEQLIHWVYKTFEGEYNGEFDVEKDLKDELDAQNTYLNMYATLKTEIATNSALMRLDLSKLDKISYETMDLKHWKSKALFEEQLNNVGIWHPIELRYQKNWIKAQMEQHEYRGMLVADNLNEELQNLVSTIEVTSDITQLVERSTHWEIDLLRSKFESLKGRLDHDLEEVEGDIAYYKRDLYNLKEMRRFQEKEMIRFDEELIATQEIIERDLNKTPPLREVKVKKGCAAKKFKKKPKKK